MLVSRSSRPIALTCSFIHSFWRLIYRLFKTLLLRGAPSPVTAKEEGLEEDVKFGKAGHQQGTQLIGEVIPCRWAHNRKGCLLVCRFAIDFMGTPSPVGSRPHVRNTIFRMTESRHRPSIY